MVSAGRRTQGLQNGEPLALRSRTSPEAGRTDIAEVQPTKTMRMTGVVVPQNSNVRRGDAAKPSEAGILDAHNAERIARLERMTEHKAQDAHDEVELPTAAVSARSKTDVTVAEDSHPTTDVIQPGPEQHVRFGDDADVVEPYMTASIALGRPDELEHHLTSEESDEEAPPESATTARTPSQVTFPSSRFGKPRKRKATTTSNVSEKTLAMTNEDLARESPQGQEQGERTDGFDLIVISGSNLPVLKSNTMIRNKSVKRLDEKPRKDIARDGVIYRFRPAGDGLTKFLPAKQNPISRSSRESLLKRKRVAPYAKPKFIKG